MTLRVIYQQTTEIFEYSGLLDVDSSPNAYVNNATVTLTVQDRYGNAVKGTAWPISMSYVSGSNGTYKASAPDTLTLTDYKEYIGLIDIESASGNTVIKAPIVVMPRTA